MSCLTPAGKQVTPLTSHRSITRRHRGIQTTQQWHTQSHKCTLTCKGQVFGYLEEGVVPREKPQLHRENVPSPFIKTPGHDLKWGPPCCKATVLINLWRNDKVVINKSCARTLWDECALPLFQHRQMIATLITWHHKSPNTKILAALR